MTKKEKAALSAGNTVRQEHCKIEDMLSFIADHPSKYLAKTVNSDDVTINYIFDDHMLQQYMHMKSNCELFMSATIGDFREFASTAGLNVDKATAISLPSTFDFSESQIYYSNENRMSYSEKDESLKKILKQVVELCRKHNRQRGIIQTGNYSNAKYLKDNLPEDVLKRCLFYNGTKEKSTMLESFTLPPIYRYDNKILIGPTLIEGLNFPDNACRFQICIKIPYGCLGNQYIQKKKDLVEGWYEYDAITKICQGVGRGIRHETDWCKTYILDGCVCQLLRKLRTIPVFKNRLKLL